MPAMWKGAIGFGLVSIPVELQSATGDHDIRFHQVHVADGGRVRNRRRCEVCGEEVAQSEIARGYEEAGQQAVLTDEDLENELPLPSKRLIDVLAFVDEHDTDPVRLARAYYVAPQAKTSDKPYALLRDTMAEHGRAAVAKIAIGTRESLALLRVRGEVLVLHTMYWPDEVRQAPATAADVTVGKSELRMMDSLMDHLGQDFRLAEQEDLRQKALADLVTAKLDSREPSHEAPEEPREGDSEVIDLMDALKASLGDAEQGARKRTGTAGKRTGAAKTGSGAGKKTAAKKTTARKTAARTAEAKKPANGKAAGGRRRTG
jgi:DNA end-binding protein Ku